LLATNRSMIFVLAREGCASAEKVALHAYRHADLLALDFFFFKSIHFSKNYIV
jgi:hypothetical protein